MWETRLNPLKKPITTEFEGTLAKVIHQKNVEFIENLDKQEKFDFTQSTQFNNSQCAKSHKD